MRVHSALDEAKSGTPKCACGSRLQAAYEHLVRSSRWPADGIIGMGVAGLNTTSDAK